MQELLSDAKTIELKNPQRDKYFRVLAEVWIDGESLGEKLKNDGLAKDYDGEGLGLSGEGGYLLGFKKNILVFE